MSQLCSMTWSRSAEDFVDGAYFEELLSAGPPSPAAVREVVAKSLEKKPLSLDETALLLRADQGEMVEEVFQAARTLKRNVYGNRIVLFAPLYVGNDCVNDCAYCAFKRSNRDVVRRTLDAGEVRKQVEAMQRQGHKRLILVFGEHPRYDARAIADCVRTVYGTKTEPHGEIRRANVNAAPMDQEGFRIIKESGIGTYQIFQETYHKPTYERMHPRGTRKGDFLWRLDGLSRAMEVGQDDVGIGALFGLAEWRFEVLGLVAHALHLQKHYGCGPHTVSFPRLQPACGVTLDDSRYVSDHDFKRLIAILRLAVPYTGLICTARERAEIRREVMGFGVSQIDAGSRIELGGYTEAGDTQCMEREQFALGDIRPLDTVMRELLVDGYIPSFCTACYRLGRTGEHFMEFAIPGFIKRFCSPNALSTLMEYLVDYATPATREAGLQAIRNELDKLGSDKMTAELRARLDRIQNHNERDLYL